MNNRRAMIQKTLLEQFRENLWNKIQLTMKYDNKTVCLTPYYLDDLLPYEQHDPAVRKRLVTRNEIRYDEKDASWFSSNPGVNWHTIVKVTGLFNNRSVILPIDKVINLFAYYERIKVYNLDAYLDQYADTHQTANYRENYNSQSDVDATVTPGMIIKYELTSLSDLAEEYYDGSAIITRTTGYGLVLKKDHNDITCIDIDTLDIMTVSNENDNHQYSAIKISKIN